MPSMADKLRLTAGDASGWGGGVAQPQATRKATDLSPHVDGGPSSAAQTNAGASRDATSTLYMSAALVIGAVVLLWLMGALVFRSISV